MVVINTFKKSKTLWMLLISILLFSLLPLTSDAQYALDDKVSFVYIKGTSTLHNWIASVEKMNGTLQAEVEGNHLVKINSVKISIPATSLNSGKKAMNKNMYKALKSDKHPNIVYELKSHAIDKKAITAKGELTIAGVTKNVESKVTQKEIGKHIKIEGEVKLKMSDFNIKPPEFLLGAFKTGDEITISFYFMFCDKS